MQTLIKLTLITTLTALLANNPAVADHVVANHSSHHAISHHTTANHAISHTAKQLNTQGFRQYKQGNHVQALRLFRRAVKADENYALAQYNLACTTAIALDRCLVGDFEETQDDDELWQFISYNNTFSALKKSIQLDPKRLQRSKTDPDLADIRKSYRYYHEILGYDNHNNQQLTTILQNVDWQSTGMRLYHTEPYARMIFLKNGQVQIRIAHLIDGEVPKNSLPWYHTYQNGRYKIANGVVTLEIEGQQIKGRIDDEGTLIFDDKQEVLPTNRYRFSRPECFSA